MGGIVSCISNLLYISEKITLCTACTGLICCLVLTITMSLGMGIGLGYNYCFVDMKTKVKHVQGRYVYPGPERPIWPVAREGRVVEEPEIEEISEDDARRPQYIPEDFPSKFGVIMSPKLFREKPRSNFTLTGNEDIIYNLPSAPDSESFNRTESSVNTTIKAANNNTNAKVAISERSSEGISSTTESGKTTEFKTSIKVETKERNPDPHIVKNSNSKKVKKLVIPITGLDLISLLSKLSAENRNYSLQVVTT